MTATEQAETVIHVLWINAGLICDGDVVALTATTQPSPNIGELWVLNTPKVAKIW